MGSLRTNIRYGETGWELRCGDCERRGRESAFWPLTLEFWRPEHGMTRCRACWNTVRRERWARASADERRRKNAANRQRRYRAKLRAYREIVGGVHASDGHRRLMPSTLSTGRPDDGGTMAA